MNLRFCQGNGLKYTVKYILGKLHPDRDDFWYTTSPCAEADEYPPPSKKGDEDFLRSEGGTCYSAKVMD